MVIVKFRVLSGTLSMGYSGSPRTFTNGYFDYAVFYSATALSFLHYSNSCTYEIADIYIGSGLYDSLVKDRAGNGNDFTNTACTPVNTKWGKGLSFNGSTSFLQASSPVIGTTGTIAVRFKKGAASGTITSNANTVSINGFAFYFSGSTTSARFRNGTSAQDLSFVAAADTTLYHTAIIIFDASAQILLRATCLRLKSTNLPWSALIFLYQAASSTVLVCTMLLRTYTFVS
jgi:hypothetical protein